MTLSQARRRRALRWSTTLLSTLTAAVVSVPTAVAEPDASARTVTAATLAGFAQLGDWPSAGQNIFDSHSNVFERAINPFNVGSLAPEWTFTTAGDVSATPAVVGGVVYFPDWGGEMNAVSASTGKVLWQEPISSYDGVVGAVSRTGPAVADGVVYIGDQNGAHLMAISADTGKLLWATQLDPHPAAILTASPLVYNGVVYEGVSSTEEALAANPAYPCCTFRGSVVALSARTGQILWKTYTVPDNAGAPGGYSGGSVWGSTAALDPFSNTLYVATGNNYTIPSSATACQAAGGTPDQCLSPDDHVDSILALNASTGALEWADSQGGFDTWTTGCFSTGANCPPPPLAGPDADFGSGPNLFTIRGQYGLPEVVVGVGEKSGQYWAADARTGKVIWGTDVGPGSALGGIEWGSATDGQRIYVAESDFGGASYTPAGGTTPITSGSWAALDPQTGKILWQTPDPSGGYDIGALATANGVVYAGSLSGNMYALSAATGKILWSYKGAGSSNDGPAVVGNMVFWGNGYSHLGPAIGSPSTTFYAFSLPGRFPGGPR